MWMISKLMIEEVKSLLGKIINFARESLLEIILIISVFATNFILSFIGVSPKGWLGIFGLPIIIFGVFILLGVVIENMFGCENSPNATGIIVVIFLIIPNYFITNKILTYFNTQMSVFTYVIILLTTTVGAILCGIVYEYLEIKLQGRKINVK